MNESYHEKNMTTISYAAYDAATQMGTSPGDAAALLLNKVEIRKFKDVLLMFADEDGLKELLIQGLCANDAERKKASVDKKVRGWLSGKNQPTAREDLLELCFVLRLNAEQADTFLTRVSDEGLHWRNPRELVFAFALNHGIKYIEACELYNRVNPEQACEDSETESFTPLIRQEVQSCKTEDELRQYLSRMSGKLGKMHNSAYQQFMAMMQVLEMPQSLNESDERRYSTREIVEKYLDKRIPTVREGKNLEEKKRCILADWPDEIALSRMKNRKADITRKTLILLFLATDGGDSYSDEDWYDADEEQENDADAAFRSSYMRLNQMLVSCGYGMLDPRNAFDWIVIYCMRVENESVSMDGLNERLSHVLEVLFDTAASDD